MRLFEFEHESAIAWIEPDIRRLIRGRCVEVAGYLGGRITTEESLWEPPTQLRPWSTDEVEAPTDVVAARLLPPARESEDELAGEFRRMTDQYLREEKLGQLQHLYDSLEDEDHDDVRLSMWEALDWAAGINTIRLAMATRAGVDSPERAEALSELGAWDQPEPPKDEAEEFVRVFGRLYVILGALQESLLEVLLTHGPAATGRRPGQPGA